MRLERLKNKLKDITTQCSVGNHNLKQIYIESIDSSVDNCIMWCSDCGAIVVDVVVDGKLMPGYHRKMELPKIAIELKNY